MSKGGIASLKLFLKSAEYIPSTFDIHYSTFAFSKFLLPSDWTLAASGGADT
jgi:hypothetical protein